MRYWNEHPEEMEAISQLPPSQQLDAMRAAVRDPRVYGTCDKCGESFDRDWHDCCPNCGGW